MRKERAPDLTEERIKVVLETLDGWTGKLTWDLLLDAVESACGHRYSRFTFADYPEIATAFSFRKDTLRGTWKGERGAPKDEKVRAALEQAARNKNKAERLQRENELLLEQFVIWATNAEREGVTMDKLNKPLPKPHRDQNKEGK